MLSGFLETLFEAGRVEIPRPEPESDIDAAAATAVLSDAERLWRVTLPRGLPALDSDTAIWGATKLYRAAQFLVYRDIDADIIQQELAPRQPAPQTVAEHYSADLCLRFMKDLLRLARVASGSDPLVDHVQELLQDWPLSAVGTGVTAETTSPVWTDGPLRLMYLDRVTGTHDSKTQELPHVQREIELWTRLAQYHSSPQA